MFRVGQEEEMCLEAQFSLNDGLKTERVSQLLFRCLWKSLIGKLTLKKATKIDSSTVDFYPNPDPGWVSCLLRTQRNWHDPLWGKGQPRDLPDLPGDSGEKGGADGLFCSLGFFSIPCDSGFYLVSFILWILSLHFYTPPNPKCFSSAMKLRFLRFCI